MAGVPKPFRVRHGLDSDGNPIKNLGDQDSELSLSGGHSLSLVTTAATVATLPAGTVELASKAYVDSVSGGGGSGTVIRDVVVSTAVGTVAKVGTVTGDASYVPQAGDYFMVEFTNGTNVSNPTLNINSSGAYNIWLGRTNVSTTTLSLTSGPAHVLMYFNGTKYLIMGSHRTSDSTEAYGVRHNNASVIAGSTITKYKVIMMGPDGRYHMICSGDTGSSGAKTVSTQGFLLGAPIFYYYASTTVISENGVVNVAYLYDQVSVGTNGGYILNTLSGWTAHRHLYLKGTIESDGLFYLVGGGTNGSDYVTQDLPTTDDGYVYVLLGTMYTTTNSFRLLSYHPAFVYKNGRLRWFDNSGTMAFQDADNVNITGGVVQAELRTSTAFVSGGAPIPTGYLILHDSSGTAYRIAAAPD